MRLDPSQSPHEKHEQNRNSIMKKLTRRWVRIKAALKAGKWATTGI
jgi:hypothetical protein